MFQVKVKLGQNTQVAGIAESEQLAEFAVAVLRSVLEGLVYYDGPVRHPMSEFVSVWYEKEKHVNDPDA